MAIRGNGALWLGGGAATILTGLALLSAAAAPVPPPVPANAGSDAQRADAEFFETRVRPVLAAQCYKCHGPAKQLGGLRLDSLEATLKGGARGPALAAGKPEKSLLLKAILHQKGAPPMPPAGKLKPAEVDALTRWIAQGAVWPGYPESTPAAGLWSLKPVRRPAPPRVKNPEWVRNPIDAFVLARLEAKGLAPAPPADRATLIRRAFYDLTGLPPTPEEVRTFVSDHRPDAYERLVDRLLASPRYGERWARYWLDLVRYADSSGYERDAEKPYSWKYRDYVIRAFNEDRPYTQFVTEQLAGDELPNRTEETLAATGLLRVGTWDDEPNDPLEYRYERLDDLVNVAGTAFLGLTVKCARCHDHKFDPISQRDYYAFAANFYGGYLDEADRKLQGGPPPDRLGGLEVLAFTDQGREAPPLHRLKNGEARSEAEEVPPGFLQAIGPLGHRIDPAPENASTTRRRLQLAAWMTDPKNPLPARVMVNRVWQYHFGEGIVRSPNNFGRTGELPSHPELLDWLASSFAAGAGSLGRPEPGTRNSEANCGWRSKPLHRMIMLSNTYRMASVHPLAERYEQLDSGNHLLWRQNRRRLDADALRDSMLAVSGELNLKMGGRGFFPTVSSEALEGLSRKGAEWTPSTPDEQRRRTVYMFLKRALLMPLLTTFDFGDTTQPLGQRDVTIVPTQALTLLNNDFVHERAAGLAERVERDTQGAVEGQVTRAWALALGRPPTARERATALRHVSQVEADAARRSPGAPMEADLPAKARLWLRADRGVSTDSEGRVLRWTDSGSATAAAPPSPKNAPTLVKGAVSGQPALRFDGQARFLALPDNLLSSQQLTIIAVANDRDGGGQHREIFSNWRREDNVGTSLFLGLTQDGMVRFTDVFAPAGRVERPEEPFVLTAVSNGGGAVVYQNRREIARRNSPLPERKLTAPYVIGQQGNIQGEYWNGDLAELWVYDRALTPAELGKIWDWTAHRYGIAPTPSPRRLALTSLCRVLLNTNEFCFVD